MSTAIQQVDPSVFQEAMSRFAGAVTIIATEVEARPSGMVATAVCSLSADPASMLVCVNKSASTHDPIIRSSRFSVNVLSAEQSDLVGHFSKAAGAARFEAGRWQTMLTGSPILEGAEISFDCEVAASYDGFTHTIFVGRVVAVIHSDDAAARALIWHRRRLAHCAVD